MKQLLMPVVLLYFLSTTACMKNLTHQESRSTTEEIYKVTKQINDAKNYFNIYIDTKAAQKFKKIPNWDKASVAQWNNNEEVVLLPLQYDKNYTFSTNFSGNHKFVLAEKSFLIIGKDKVGNYYTEIHTYYPDEKFANYPSKVFSGFATTQHWNNTIKDIYKFEKGKMYKLLTNKSAVADATDEGVTFSASKDCYYINYFSCPPDYTDLSQCEYLGSEPIGCGDDATMQCEGNCGGIAPPAADSIFQVVPRHYVIGGMYGYYYAEATFILKGYKFSFSPVFNYFTELPTGSTQLVITNPGVPNPIYTHQYAISSWLSLTHGNKTVNTEARGSAYTNLYGTQVMEKSKPYAAANEF